MKRRRSSKPPGQTYDVDLGQATSDGAQSVPVRLPSAARLDSRPKLKPPKPIFRYEEASTRNSSGVSKIKPVQGHRGSVGAVPLLPRSRAGLLPSRTLKQLKSVQEVPVSPGTVKLPAATLGMSTGSLTGARRPGASDRAATNTIEKREAYGPAYAGQSSHIASHYTPQHGSSQT